MIRTKADKTDTGWRLNGRKIWTTNAPQADHCIVFAVTDPDRASRRAGGISVLVPTRHPASGWRVSSACMGRWVAARAPSCWRTCRSSHGNWSVNRMRVSASDCWASLSAVSTIQLAPWPLAVGRSRQRCAIHNSVRAFGKPIAEYQGVTFPLAEAAMELHAAHLMALNAAASIDRGERAVKELSMAKAYAVEIGARALDVLSRTHGAMGFTKRVSDLFMRQDVRLVNVADGTNEVLRRTIVQMLLAGDTEFAMGGHRLRLLPFCPAPSPSEP